MTAVLQMTDFMTTKRLQLTWKYGKEGLGLSDLRNSKWQIQYGWPIDKNFWIWG